MKPDKIVIRIRASKGGWEYYREDNTFTEDVTAAKRYSSIRTAIRALLLFTADFTAHHSLEDWHRQGYDDARLVRPGVTEEVI